MDRTEPRIRIFRSLTALCILTTICFVVMLIGFGAWWESSTIGSAEEHRFFAQRAGEWQKQFGVESDLRVATITIAYFKDITLFDPREGILLAPVALHMPGVQEVLDIAPYPEAIRQLEVDGIRCLTWEYAGRINREIGARAMTLVRMMPQPSEPPAAGEPWTYDSLPQDIRFDALAKVEETNEHDLNKCKAFRPWVEESGGDDADPFVRMMNLLTAVTGIISTEESKGGCADPCRLLRKKSLEIHEAHVIAVMALREIGIPCFGFSGIDPGNTWLVGIFSDRTGWKFINLEAVDAGFMRETPVLVTRVPIIGEFAGAYHRFWTLAAGIVSEIDVGQLGCYGLTSWQKPNADRVGGMKGNSQHLAEWEQGM